MRGFISLIYSPISILCSLLLIFLFFGLSLHPNVEEVCYFEIAYWSKNELGYADVGRIWYKRYSYTMFTGRVEIKDDNASQISFKALNLMVGTIFMLFMGMMTEVKKSVRKNQKRKCLNMMW